MLVTVNLFLLVLLLFREWKSAQYADSARDEAVLILAQNGIALDKEILPDEMNLASLTVSRDPEAEAAQAQSLVGELLSPAPDSTTYQGELGSARFYPNGEFSAELLPGVYPLNGLSPGSHAVMVLGRMGFEAQVLETAEDGSWVRVRQLWAAAPIFTCEATLVYQDQELRSIQTGSYRLTGTPQSAPAEKPMTVVTALMEFWNSISQRGDLLCTEITGMESGYVLDSQTEPAILTPAWQITTDGGIYYLNAVTGEIENHK